MNYTTRYLCDEEYEQLTSHFEKIAHKHNKTYANKHNKTCRHKTRREVLNELLQLGC